MSYKICAIEGEPRYDSLPVLKVTQYPDTDVNDRMFAQCQLCLTPSQLIARVWAFETAPSEESELSVRLAGPAGEVLMSITAAGVHTLKTGKGLLLDCLSAYMIGGGDLQGEYWGGVLGLPVEILREELGLNELLPGTIMRGNVIKKNPGIGSAFLSPGRSPDDPESYGELQIVGY